MVEIGAGSIFDVVEMPGETVSENIIDVGVSSDEVPEEEQVIEDVSTVLPPVVSSFDMDQYNEILETVRDAAVRNDSVSITNIVDIDPNSMISVNSVSLNVVSADDLMSLLSGNSVSVNVSNNYISVNNVISINDLPWFNKSFDSYTTSEGILFVIMVSLLFGFIASHLLKLARYLHP